MANGGNAQRNTEARAAVKSLILLCVYQRAAQQENDANALLHAGASVNIAPHRTESTCTGAALLSENYTRLRKPAATLDFQSSWQATQARSSGDESMGHAITACESADCIGAARTKKRGVTVPQGR